MGEENKMRDAADAVKGIVEAVPVYQDVVQPAAKEVGAALQTVARTIHIALAPLSAMVWGFDRIKDYLEQALTEKLRDVPRERIVTPNPAVAGPAVEALRFAAQESSLRELYANLLATSMDADTARYAHPAFVEIIRQMAADEGRIVALLASEKQFNLDDWEAKTKNRRSINLNTKYTALAKKAGCSFLDLIPSYLDNLSRLGLIVSYEMSETIHTANFWVGPHYRGEMNLHTPVTNTDRLEMIDYLLKNQLKQENIAYFHISIQVITLTSLGEQFCRACVVQPATPPKQTNHHTCTPHNADSRTGRVRRARAPKAKAEASKASKKSSKK